jgi:bifunctional non-homologous end joining protein LigD
LTDQAPAGDDWAHEIKYDGYRILSRVKDHAAQLLLRNNHDWTGRLHTIADAVAALPVSTSWLDGEVVAIMRDGSISFQALQNAFGTRSDTLLGGGSDQLGGGEI